MARLRARFLAVGTNSGGSCRSIGRKVVFIIMQRVDQLSIQLLRRLHLRVEVVEVLPADQAAQPDLTAAQESEEQQEDRVLTRQRGLGLGAPAELLVNSFQCVGGAQCLPLRNRESSKGEELVA